METTYIDDKQSFEVFAPALNPEDRKLFEACTYAPTERLQGLRKGILECTPADLQELFQIWVEGCAEIGTMVDMKEFGRWLSGSDEWFEYGPAEVTW